MAQSDAPPVVTKRSSSPGWAWLATIPVILAAILVYVPGFQQRASTTSLQYQPTVTVRQGTLLGRMVDDGTFPEPLEGFLGIPYALPPVKQLRFKPAVPVPDGNGTIDAYYLGPR